MKNKGTKKFFLIYGIIILFCLISIMFLIPDSVFLKRYENLKIPVPTTEKKEFVSFAEQKERLLQKKYEYEYLLLDSMGTKSYTYECEGKINKELESGTCSQPESFSYTEQNKSELFKFDYTYTDINKILEVIGDTEGEETKYSSTREYHYKTKIEELETEIIIYTDLDNINRIDISNAYMTYILKYNNVSY